MKWCSRTYDLFLLQRLDGEAAIYMLKDKKRNRCNLNDLQMFPVQTKNDLPEHVLFQRPPIVHERVQGSLEKEQQSWSWPQLLKQLSVLVTLWVLEQICSCYLPSPSSTTAWITMGNTPRSRSKFNFKEKDRFNNAAQRKATVIGKQGRCSRLLLSTRWNRFWKRAWRTAGSPPAYNAPFQRPARGSLGCTCTQRGRHTAKLWKKRNHTSWHEGRSISLYNKWFDVFFFFLLMM